MATHDTVAKDIQLGRRLIAVAGGILLVSSTVKFLHPTKAVNYMAFLGYHDEKLYLIAAIELVIALLFLYERTRVAGAMLVSAYFGGAIAAHLADHPLTGMAPIIVFNFNHHYLGTIPALIVLLCAWLGLWFSRAELFQRGFRSNETPVHAARATAVASA